MHAVNPQASSSQQPPITGLQLPNTRRGLHGQWLMIALWAAAQYGLAWLLA